MAAKIASRSGERNIMGAWMGSLIPERLADPIFFWSSVFFLISLIVGVVTSVLIFASANVKEQISSRAISEALKTAAQANERAAEATLKAEQERTARLKLEEKLAPRMLSQDAALALVQKLTQFKGSSLDIVVYPTGTSDIGPLQDQLTRIFRAAGWTVRRWSMLGTEFVVGVGIAVSPGATSADRSLADMIVQELSASGIAAGRAADLVDNSFPIPATGPAPVGDIAPLRMSVGTKPP